MEGTDKLNNLSELHFPNNVLSDESVDMIVKAMSTKKITILNLANNKASHVNHSFLSFWKCLGMNYQVSYYWFLLKVINHQILQVTSEGAKTLAIFMSDEKSHLQTINFSLNYWWI